LRKRTEFTANPSSETNLQVYQEKNNTKTDKVKKRKKKKKERVFRDREKESGSCGTNR